ncbi:MAG TPA: SAM-dependent DNA methyltransferase [Desulfuromonadales bacterium]|nr:SAM-dependent DNA methyltransferase [Desulfuromonadales bacterium]
MQREPKKTKTATSSNCVVDINKELFQAAVNLRGSIEPADYKRYVLPIIFLRFLSLRYERRRAELEVMVAEPKSEYFGDKGAVNDPDEYRSAGAFIVPEEARWENIVKQAQADDIKVRLDNILELLEKTYPDKLRGLLPRIYAGSNLERENVTGLINLFSKDIFRQDHGGEDIIGRVYEYFIGEFASSEGKRGGEYFTPASIVRCLINMLEPTEGTVYDPCCGSGGMFVQSDEFTRHNRKLSFYGQESKDFTYRLCRMNMFIHGIDGNIQLGNTYADDKHATVKASYIIANPPFNDGSKGENGWGAHNVPDKDPRLKIDGDTMPLAPRNANTMWMLHFLNHLVDNGTAGFVMATGELSNGETARLEVRKALVEHNYVDCIVQLSGQLFANTQIPCGLWFLSKNRTGTGGFRKRTGEVLFIDGRKLGALIPGSRKQKQLTDEELEQVAAVYREFKRSGVPPEVPGFCRVASLDEIREHKYALTPGRYVGAEEGEEDDEAFEDKMQRLTTSLTIQMGEAAQLDKEIRENLAGLGFIGEVPAG